MEQNNSLQINELRIGNYLKNFLGEEFQINIQTLEMLNGNIPNEFPLPKPIPLTKEWALRFGFNGPQGEKDHTNIYCWSENVSIQFGHHAEGSEDLEHIKYVHQLQNLYFALTQKELIWNNQK